MKASRAPILVAIVGGSGAGKSWLANKLAAELGDQAARLSLDDFYRDRSHLSPDRRAKINFDNPRAIDWPSVERVLKKLAAGQTADLPCYDFSTHCRARGRKALDPKPILLMDGLWLLRRPSVREWFALRIFVQCPMQTRLRRRLARDMRERGRTRASVVAQFRNWVQPMHARYIEPQLRYADVVFRETHREKQLEQLVAGLRQKLSSQSL
jgi:uridine kinase